MSSPVIKEDTRRRIEPRRALFLALREGRYKQESSLDSVRSSKEGNHHGARRRHACTGSIRLFAAACRRVRTICTGTCWYWGRICQVEGRGDTEKTGIENDDAWVRSVHRL